MLLKKIFRKSRLYKKFEMDIWGYNLIYSRYKTRVSTLVRDLLQEEKIRLESKQIRYIYRIDLTKPMRRRKKFNWRFLTRKMARLFYLTLSHVQFRKLVSTAFRHDGSKEGNYILLVENRAVFILYRLQFSLNIFDLKRFVENIGLLVNGVLVTYCNLAIGFGSTVMLSSYWTKVVKYYLTKRILNRRFYFGIPRYLFVSYKLMFGFVYREPKLRDVVYPVRYLDVYRGADFE